MTAHYSDLSQDPVSAVSSLSGTESPATPQTITRMLYRAFGKRWLDLTIVVLASPFIVVIVSLLALAVARSGGQPFYSQDRVGKNGRLYRIWKLRSMVVDADAHLEAHLEASPQARAEWDSTQKLKDDPRITTFGQFLRRSSMDELPQLWNVLRGDMSLIGPRPMMPSQKPLYPGSAYYELRPGISGSWQVSARNSSTFADRAGFDTAYNRDLSLTGDIRLLLATIRVVSKGTGY